MADALSTARQELTRAIARAEKDLKALREAEAALAKVERGATTRSGNRRAARPASSGQRRGRQGKRGQQALKLITENPGITIPQLAERMKIGPNYLYRVVPKLKDEGKIRKDGKGWIAA